MKRRFWETTFLLCTLGESTVNPSEVGFHRNKTPGCLQLMHFNFKSRVRPGCWRITVTCHSSLRSTLLFPTDSTNAPASPVSPGSLSKQNHHKPEDVKNNSHLSWVDCKVEPRNDLTSLTPVTVYAWPWTSPFGCTVLADVSCK